MNSKNKHPSDVKEFESGVSLTKLFYNPPSDCVVAHCSRNAREWASLEEIYFRKSNSDYVRVLSPDSRMSFTDPVSCLRRPVMYINLVQWDDAFTGTDWISVVRLSLPDGKLSTVFDRHSLPLPKGCTSGWIASILDADSDGKYLLVNAALKYSTGPQTSKIEYWIAELDLESSILKKLVLLPRIFI